jgi:hypothetical protein
MNNQRQLLQDRLEKEFTKNNDTLYNIYELFKQTFGHPSEDKDRIDKLQNIIDYETSNGYDCNIFQEILDNIKENGYRGLRVYEENGKYQIKINIVS